MQENEVSWENENAIRFTLSAGVRGCGGARVRGARVRGAGCGIIRERGRERDTKEER